MTSEPLILFWLPHCSTCQRTARALEERGYRSVERRDMRSRRLSRIEVENLAAMVGGASQLFSRRALKYRAMNLHERELNDDEMIDLMTEEDTFIKRPVLVQGRRAQAACTVKSLDKFFKQA